MQTFEAVIVGGGPAGATAAWDLARAGRSVLLLDRDGRIKPCGGAIPPKALEEFAIPESLLKAKVHCARVISPRKRRVDMPINGFVGMVDREDFDEWLRARAAACGAQRRQGQFRNLRKSADGTVVVEYDHSLKAGGVERVQVRTRLLVGADGARSEVARQALPESKDIPFVAAYHEIVESPQAAAGEAFDGARCDVYYQGEISPDFYGWVFPHGKHTSIGVGTAHKGFSMRHAVATLRGRSGMAEAKTLRREGAPIPLRTLKRWDDGRNVILAGDAAGCVAPSSGEGIYYAMLTGRLAADAVLQTLQTGDARQLATARKRFMRAHGRIFWVLGIMQWFWYSSDRRRERFVSICSDPDVQHLTWEAYMHKRLVRARPAAHMRIFFKDLAHLLGLVRP